jgi:hypothetical protein
MLELPAAHNDSKGGDGESDDAKGQNTRDEEGGSVDYVMTRFEQAAARLRSVVEPNSAVTQWLDNAIVPRALDQPHSALQQVELAIGNRARRRRVRSSSGDGDRESKRHQT